MEYSWPSSVNVANFVTVKLDLENEEERSMNFKLRRKQMVCLVESQDVAGFINGEIVEPAQSDEQKLWRRSDRLVQGWILGSIGKDVLQYVCELETAREVWLELEKIFNEEVADSDSTTNQEVESANRDFTHYLPLYNAAITGDWETANTLFFQNNIWETEARISMDQDTALHVAVRGNANDFVRNLVQLMRPEALALTNYFGATALHYAAIIGNTEAAKAMLEKYQDLLYKWSTTFPLPITTAARCRQKNTLTYLISVYESNVEHCPFEGPLVIAFFIEIIGSEYFDVALDLIYKYPNLARERSAASGKCALTCLAEMESVFPSRESFSWWEKLIYRCAPVKQYVSRSASVSSDTEVTAHRKFSTSFQSINGVWKRFKTKIWEVMEHLVPRMRAIKDKKELHKQALQLTEKLCQEMKYLPENDACAMLQDSMSMAANNGITEIVKMIIEMYPSILATIAGMTIMSVAVSNRFENIYNLTYSMSDRKHFLASGTYSDRNTLMHMCALLAPPHRLNLVPGAALQMQRELQWFNEIQRFIPPIYKKWLNKDGKTAIVLFTEQYQELKEKGEKWMKDTGNACSIATALIATVVFAAAFTVPGGVSSETGLPVFSGERAFIIFATTNAASLFTSITSLMMFLSILTSRYAEKDFLHVLPQRLCFGLLSLFFSIIFMLIAFSVALYLEHGTEVVWFIIPVATFGWLSLASFVFLQFPLLIDVAYSTYGPGIFGKQTNRFFY